MGFAENGPPVLRQLSVRAVVDVLLRDGPTSRADLAKRTGISKQTMSHVIRTLEENGWVRANGIVGGRVGRSAITYELCADIGYAVGGEIGAATVRVGLADVTGKIVASREAPSVDRDLTKLLAQFRGLLHDVMAEAGVPAAKILAAAVATPGVGDPRTGGLRFAPNVTNAAGLDVQAGFSALFDCGVVIENDCRAALIGETWQGAAAGMDNAVFVQLGTGIGLGVIQDGKLQRGATGAAGEIAYLPFGADPMKREHMECGPLESAVGAKGIVRRYQDLGGPVGLSVRDIFDRARAGEAIAARTVRETAEIVALLVVAIGAIHDPQKIIFGGGIGRDPLMVAETREALKTRSLRSFEIETAKLGLRSTLLGALAIAIGHLHTRLFTPAAFPDDRHTLPGALDAPAAVAAPASAPAAPSWTVAAAGPVARD